LPEPDKEEEDLLNEFFDTLTDIEIQQITDEAPLPQDPPSNEAQPYESIEDTQDEVVDTDIHEEEPITTQEEEPTRRTRGGPRKEYNLKKLSNAA
ncbi:hypothetical protein SCUP515_13358, partial [Seiridium cupressi]